MADSNPTEALRLFLAIPIPETVRDELRRLQRELQPLFPSHSVRWARADQFHLTLKFFGNVSIRDVPALTEAARTICTSSPPMHLQAQGVGFFPNDFSPRVFWIDIKSKDGLLMKLQQQLETAVERFAEKQETKKFTAHITLARFEKLTRRDVERFASHALTDKTFGEWTAKEVELIKSELQPAGAIHAILETFRTKND